MINSLKKFSALGLLLLLMGVALYSCKKDDDKILDPGQYAFFAATSLTANYTIVEPTTVYKIPVGLTTPVTGGKTRTVNVTSSSTTGAVEGTHYTYTKTLTFSADKIVDTIVVSGIQAEYLTGRKDVVRFSFADAGDFQATLNSTFTLNISGPCFEGELNIEDLLGDYENTYEVFGSSSWGPYTTSISSIVSTGPTTAEITVENIYDYGWNPIKFTLDWTDINNRTVTLVQQYGIADAGTLSSSYEGGDVTVRPSPAGPGTFSWCDETIELRMQVGIVGVGWYSAEPYYVVTLQR